MIIGQGEFVRLNTITIYYYDICKSNSFKSWLLRSQPGLLALSRQKENCFFCTNMLMCKSSIVKRLLAVQRIVDQWFSGILQQILNEFWRNASSSSSPEESLGVLLRLENVEDHFITLRNICHRFAWFQPFPPSQGLARLIVPLKLATCI